MALFLTGREPSTQNEADCQTQVGRSGKGNSGLLPSPRRTEKRKKMTLRTFYQEWFDYKWQDTNNSSYMHKIASDWKRFYEDDPIVDRPIVELTTLELKTWLRWWSIPSQTPDTVPYTCFRQRWSYLPRSESTICNVAFPAKQRTISLSIVAVALLPKPSTKNMSDTARNWVL